MSPWDSHPDYTLQEKVPRCADRWDDTLTHGEVSQEPETWLQIPLCATSVIDRVV